MWGTITPLNSAIGSTAHAGLQSTLVVDNVNGTFIASFGSGQTAVGSHVSGFFPRITAPTAQAASGGVDQPIPSVSIGDAGSAILTFTLDVSHGALTLGTTTNLTVIGNGTSSVILIGATADLNAALATLSYRRDLNYSGSDTLSLQASDGFGSGSSASVSITAASPAQLAAELQALVSALQDEQALKNGQANSLIVKLNLQGNAGDVGKVEAFLNEVAALRRSGRLTQEQSQILLDEGNLLLLSLPQ